MRERGEMAIPHFFRCPISLELLEDPVTLCTGQTYDRSSIEKWLAAGNFTCPVTMQKLHDPSMVPNHTLRNLIDQWLRLGSQFDSGYSEEMDSLATMKHQLESHSTSLDCKLRVIHKITFLLDEPYPPRNSCFLQLGFLSLLLEIVFGRFETAEISKHELDEFIELSLSCIVKLLSLSSPQILNTLKEESRLASFSQLFEQGTLSMKTSLCLLVAAVSSSETKDLCHLLGNSQRLLHEIVLLVPQNSEVSKVALKALAALCSLQCNRENLIKEGAVDAIITCIASSERRGAKNMTPPLSVTVIEKLLEHESAKEALVCNPNGVRALVKMVFRVSDHECSESAVGSLLLVCHDSCRAREEAIGGGVLTQLLLLLQSQCNARIKTKARILLKMLRSKWVEDPKSDSCR